MIQVCMFTWAFSLKHYSETLLESSSPLILAMFYIKDKDTRASEHPVVMG